MSSMIALLLAAAAPPQCATVTVSRATYADIEKLKADADCFHRLAFAAATAKQRASHKASAKLRGERIRALHAAQPNPTPVDVVEAVSLPSIPSNFDISAELVPAWGTGYQHKDGEAAPDVFGAFRFICNASWLKTVDPVVYPNQRGKGHLHQGFGNTEVDEKSTYETLRTKGESTCTSKANRSAYWMPAMMNGKGQVVRPDYVSIYYKQFPKGAPQCDRNSKRFVGICVGVARGLKMLFGFDMINHRPGEKFSFKCEKPGAWGSNQPNIVLAAKGCAEGAQLFASITSPMCWNGKLDSPDHRSHLFSPASGQVCPASHPYVIPQFTQTSVYTTDADLDRSGLWPLPPGTTTWHLSSDVMPGMPVMMPGSTFHADWFGAWDDTVLAMWKDNCIDRFLNCSGGDLGNGKQLKMFNGFSWTAKPRLVPVPVDARR